MWVGSSLQKFRVRRIYAAHISSIRNPIIGKFGTLRPPATNLVLRKGLPLTPQPSEFAIPISSQAENLSRHRENARVCRAGGRAPSSAQRKLAQE